jgi:hypothetical protein
MVATTTRLPRARALGKKSICGGLGPVTGPYGRDRTTMRLVGYSAIAGAGAGVGLDAHGVALGGELTCPVGVSRGVARRA